MVRLRSWFPVVLLLLPCVLRAAVPERPISVVRSGLASATSILPKGSFNGDRFLVTWSSRDRGGQAMVLEHDGEPVSAAVALPFHAAYVFWDGRTWVAIYGNSGAILAARIDTDGVLLDREVRSVELPAGSVQKMVWTGSSLIVSLVVREPTFPDRAVLAILDSEMRLKAVRDLPARWVDLAWDGSSLLVLHEPAPSEWRASILDADGVEQRTAIISSSWPLAVGTTGEGDGFVLLARHAAQALFRVYHLDPQLVPGPTRVIGQQSSLAGSGTTLSWDGSTFAFYYATDRTGGGYCGSMCQAHAARLSREGILVEDVVVPGLYSQTFKAGGVSGAGTNLMFSLGPVSSQDSSDALQMRVGASGAALAAAAPQTLERGPHLQTAASAASSSTQSLVAWRERLGGSAPNWVFATRVDENGVVLDPQSLLLGRSGCENVAPAVARAADGFLVVWNATDGVRLARIGADGSVDAKHLRPLDWTGCSAWPPRVFSNGSTYLVVWAEQHSTDPRDTVFAVRVDAAGAVLDAAPRLLGTSVSTMEGASDGRDFLLAWEGTFLRMTAGGLRVGPPLGDDSAAAPKTKWVWWNGESYSIVEQASNRYRIRRVSADGTIVKSGEFMPMPVASWPSGGAHCEGSTCTLLEGHFGAGASSVRALVVRDDTPSVAWGEDVMLRPITTRNVLELYPATPFRLPGKRLFAVYQRPVLEPPYSGIPRLFVTPIAPGRTRVVRH